MATKLQYSDQIKLQNRVLFASNPVESIEAMTLDFKDSFKRYEGNSHDGITKDVFVYSFISSLQEKIKLLKK